MHARSAEGDQVVRVERDRRGVVTVTLDRPQVRNAFDAATVQGLRVAFDTLATDDDVRVVVLTGAGQAFSAGADLSWMSSMVGRRFEDNVADARGLEATLRSVHDCPRPVVARVNGHAFGGGTGLIACADVAVAVRSARFGFTEVRLGLAPAVISPYVLPRIGIGAARRLFLTGERFDAEEAVRIGLVSAVCDDDALDDRVGAVVDDLLAGGPEAQAAIKRLLRDLAGAARPTPAAADLTTETIARLRVAREGQEGMRAFLEQRAPAWRDADGGGG